MKQDMDFYRNLTRATVIGATPDQVEAIAARALEHREAVWHAASQVLGTAERCNCVACTTERQELRTTMAKRLRRSATEAEFTAELRGVIAARGQ